MPTRRKFEFKGSQGEQLAALLETPDQEPGATTLFAHCFTCGKDIAAASRISRSLVQRGYAVMLVMHSPVDTIVNIAEAERIYKAAHHPKSFVSLDDADHLLSRAEDSEYVAVMIAAWATRQVRTADTTQRPDIKTGEIRIHECPVHRTLTGQLSIDTRQIPE